MPIVQSTKNRLTYDVFNCLSCSYRYASQNNVSVIDPTIFSYFAINSLKPVLIQYFPEEKISLLISMLKNCMQDACNKKFVEFDSIKMNKHLTEAIKASIVDPDGIGLLKVTYTLFKDDKILRSISSRADVNDDSILYVINRESQKKKKTAEKQTPTCGKSSQQAKEDPIKKFCIDYNQKASDGAFNPVFCRDVEIDQVLVALMKKTKANPLLIGEPGVGKTAIVEALAQRFVDGNVPDRLKGYKIIAINMASVIQGTTLRGQFEDRMEEILKYVVKDEKTILFIDEMHTVIGSGSGEDSGLDGSNIMKPYLARGEIKCIGATTFDDYYRRMRKDKAFSRRFQRIFVSEPDEKQTEDILTGLSKNLKEYHSCQIDDETIPYTVKLCRRFISDRFFPDKAIDCLDHACAKSSLFTKIVTKDIVEQVISEFSDIPISIIKKADMERLENIDKAISSEVLGNDAAIYDLCNRIRFAYSTKESRKGILCSIVVYGPSGVGKKTVAERVAEHLYGHNSVLVINGAEFSEPHSINRLIGSPPGYVGHNEETYILREIRRRPNVMIIVTNPLLMHNSVIECLNSIMKTGRLIDVNDMSADFSNCIIVFCVDLEKSNNRSMGFVENKRNEDQLDTQFKDIKKKSSLFKSCFYSVKFSEVEDVVAKDIIRLELSRLSDDLKNSCIIVNHDTLCIDWLYANVKGSPADLRKKVREILENAICNGFKSGANEYALEVNNDTIIAKVNDHASCPV